MEHQSSLRKILVLLTTTAAALGVTLGLPMKKAVAAPQDSRMMPSPMMHTGRLEVIQPRFINPTAVNLIRIADQALSDQGLAQRIFREPDAVAAQFHLSNAERLVLRHMDAEQFQVARGDAQRLVAERLAHANEMRMPQGATDVRLITERMIVGRAILAAVGRSYLDAADAHACCPWSKAVEIGVNSDPALYNAAFVRPGQM